MIDEAVGIIVALVLFAALLYFPVRFFLLIGQVKALEKTVRAMSPGAAPAAVPVAPVTVVPVAAVMPPPLPVKPVVTVQPDPLVNRLRDLGLLPPDDLKGEYALGAWWAVRVGGILAVAAVVFLGIWLNLRSTIPPIVRVLEVALVGAGLFWGGLRLSAKRKDLGEVVAAAGLGVWQFAAWATYGLDKMRVCETPAQASLVQFVVAALVAGLALRKQSKLFGQLAVAFAAVAVYFSIGEGAAPWPTATGAGLIALLGVVLMVRGPWGSAGVLGLVGSQACLLFLYDAMPAQGANYLPLQLAALGSFLVLWLGERMVKDDAVFLGRGARNAFQLAAFFAPAGLTLFLATGGEAERATAAFLLAAVAALAGWGEHQRQRLVFESMLLSAVVLVAAGGAWLIDGHLVWLIWALAAAATLMVGERTRSELVRWASEILAGVAAYAFIDAPSSQPWLSLLAILALGLMLSFREGWERQAGLQQARRVIGIIGVALAVLALQKDFPKADAGWPWLVLLVLSAVRFRPGVLWAALPAYLFTACVVVFWRPIVGSTSFGWAAFWGLLCLLLNAFALWRLIGREGQGAKALRMALPFFTALLAYACAHHLAGFLLLPSTEPRDWSWKLTLTWVGGGLLLVALTNAWRRLGAEPTELSLAAMGALGGFFIQGVVSTGAGLRQLGLPHAVGVLLGLACLLQVLATNTRGQGAWGTVQRSLLGVAALFVCTFIMLGSLPGAGVSLGWALASILTFVIGHLLKTRSLRMVGLMGLVIATLRVLSHDVTDLLGRIVACAAVALAFFGIAWLYGRLTADKRDV